VGVTGVLVGVTGMDEHGVGSRAAKQVSPVAQALLSTHFVPHIPLAVAQSLPHRIFGSVAPDVCGDVGCDVGGVGCDVGVVGCDDPEPMLVGAWKLVIVHGTAEFEHQPLGRTLVTVILSPGMQLVKIPAIVQPVNLNDKALPR